ncbi:MAG: ABC transporter permease [Gemmatimonadaceae bacterium]
MSAATRRPGAFLSLCFRVLDLVGLLVPPEFRADWKREWRAELWQRWRTFDAPGGDPDATHRIALFLRCFGAFPDALSLWSWSLDDLSHDLRYAARLLRRQFGFATVAALTLALGIGASTAIFSVVNAVLLRPLPYPEPDRLARIWSVNRGQDLTEAGVSIPDFADWRDGNRVAARIAAFSMLPTGLTLVGRDEPERLPTAYVTEDFFGTIGVPARLGRGILPEEHKDGANRVIVMSDALWRRRFGADPAVIGRAIPFESDVFTVVGVMPPGFDYPSPRAELWAPTSLIPESSIPRLRPVRWLNVIARLRPGVSPEAAQTAMNTVARRLEAQYPESNAGWGETRLLSLREQTVGGVRRALVVLFGAVTLVLLIACVNVANLLLARATTREREMAVRTALGASRGRIVRQLLTESVVLALIGGALGTIVATRAVPALVTLSGEALPRAGQVGTDWRVLLFALALSLATGLVFGLVPAIRAPRTDLQGALRDGGRGSTAGRRSHRLRALLVMSEMALALVLATSAGLMVKSFRRLAQVDPGFRPDNVLAVSLTIRKSRYPDATRYLPFYRHLLERVREVPGVQAVGAIKNGPLLNAASGGEPYPFTVVGRSLPPAGAEPRADVHPVSPDYFRAMGIPILRGRPLSEQDDETAPLVAIISGSLARRFWPGASPVGETITYGGRPRQIVGVAGDVRYARMDSLPGAAIYVPVFQEPRIAVTLLVRTAGDPAAAAPGVRAAIRALDPSLPITQLVTMRQAMLDSVARPRFFTLLLSLFGALALALAALGLYGVIAFTVSQRTHEIGVRIALGAGRGSVTALTLRYAMAPALAGIAIGLAASLLVTRVLASQLYGVTATDPATFMAVSALLAAVALVAAYLPARRAARVSPMEALRG